MPCDSRRNPQQTEQERRREIDVALAKLVAAIGTGTVRVVVGPTGAIAFAGWKDNAGVTDVCAFRTLTQRGSWELRQAIARAEQVAGRKVSTFAVGQGVHSHDGGQTWHPGH